MKTVSLIDVGVYLPPNVVTKESLESEIIAAGRTDELSRAWFDAPHYRRHVDRAETASSMFEKAALALIDKLNINPQRDIDIIITNTVIPDEMFTGAGADTAHRLGCEAKWVYDLHNTGCISFVFMLELARIIMNGTDAKTAIVCNGANAAGRIYAQSENRKNPQSAVPGDGATVTYLNASEESPILHVEQKCYGAHANDMRFIFDDDRKYWESGQSQPHFSFSEGMISSIIERGNSIVPDAVNACCDKINVSPSDLDLLLTNQPNLLFLKNWRERLGLPAEKHLDTFDEYGNLIGAGIPVNLEKAIREDRIKPNDLVVMAGFSHAADYAAAAAMRWKPNL